MCVCRPERIRKNVNNLFKIRFRHIQRRRSFSGSLYSSRPLSFVWMHIIFSPQKFTWIYCCWCYCCRCCWCCSSWRVWQGLAHNILKQNYYFEVKPKIVRFFSFFFLVILVCIVFLYAHCVQQQSEYIHSLYFNLNHRLCEHVYNIKCSRHKIHSFYYSCSSE